MPTILVTGMRGFTGQYLAAALRARGARVLGLVQGAARDADEIACDLADAQAVRTAVALAHPTHVAHLAALAFVGHGDARAFYDVNLFGTFNLLEALATLDAPPQRVLIASSANVYGTPAVEVIDESVCPAPVNHYANSKLAMEHIMPPCCWTRAASRARRSTSAPGTRIPCGMYSPWPSTSPATASRCG